MLRRKLFVLSIGLIFTCTSGNDAEIMRKIAELERLVHSQQTEIDSVRKENRRLQSSATILLTSDNKVQLTADDLVTCLDHMWLLLCGALVMFMQAGFAMVEAGTCRERHSKTILLKNMIDVCFGALGWWAFGWAFAFGGPLSEGGDLESKILGTAEFFGTGFSEASDVDGRQDGGLAGGKVGRTKQLNWTFQWACCSVAATIVSGGIAERVRLPGYILYSSIMTTFIYPFIVAWTWGHGWLWQINDVGFTDYAGGGVVHMTGGIAALVGAYVVGPRDERWSCPQKFEPHNLEMVTQGTFILWFGWYGFNCGSTLNLHEAILGALAGQIAMNTTIAAATGGVTMLFFRLWMKKKYELGAMCNGIIAGLVSISAPCGNIECGSAFLVGLFGALTYQLATHLVTRAQIDDPAEAFAVHGAPGAWGLMATVIFDWGKGVDYASSWNGYNCQRAAVDADSECVSGAWAELLVANLVGLLAIIVWTTVSTLAVFRVLKYSGLLIGSKRFRKSGTVGEHGMDEDYPAVSDNFEAPEVVGKSSYNETGETATKDPSSGLSPPLADYAEDNGAGAALKKMKRKSKKSTAAPATTDEDFLLRQENEPTRDEHFLLQQEAVGQHDNNHQAPVRESGTAPDNVPSPAPDAV